MKNDINQAITSYVQGGQAAAALQGYVAARKAGGEIIEHAGLLAIELIEGAPLLKITV
ncbi:MAG: hypothetical protein K1X65_21490 [Caldilineales bacterium]|nr:hypothetical protein [Caldilineales bacterium]MCW5858150.1 hypothetical protein [Caldilineales bacterium]